MPSIQSSPQNFASRRAARWLIFCCMALGLLAPSERAFAADEADSSVVARYRLGNGLRVVLNPDPALSEVAVCVSLALGSRHELEGKAGSAWLLQALSASGALHRSSAMATEFASDQGVVHTWLGVDDSGFMALGKNQQLGAALALQAARFERAELDAGSFETERERALAGHRRTFTGGALEHAETRLRELMFQGYWPYAHAIEGHPSSISSLQVGDVLELHARRARTSFGVLAIVGNFDERRARTLIERHFSRIGAGAAATPDRAERPALPRQTSERFNVSIDRRAKVPSAFHAWRVPGATHESHAGFELVAALLARPGEGDEDTRGQSAPIQGIQAWTWPLTTAGALVVRLDVDRGSSVDKARAALERELDRLARAGPNETELSAAKSRLREARQRELADAEQRARLLAWHERYAGDARGAFGAPERYEELSRAELRGWVARHLGELQRTSVEVYPPGWPQDPEPPIVHRRHIVKPGETLTGIASRYRSNVDAIAAANRIKTHRFIFPGQALTIPVEPDKAASSGRSYVVKKGDSLSVIAKRHGISTAELARANRRTPRQRIVAGERLVIPPAPRKATTPKAAAPRRHRVAAGETLLGLAKRYGVPAASIAKANGRKPRDRIVIGEWLIIPRADAGK